MINKPQFTEGKIYEFCDDQDNVFRAKYEGFIEEQDHFEYTEIPSGSILSELGNEIGDDLALSDFFVSHMKYIIEVK